MFTDTHAHLESPRLLDEAEAVVERAREAGVTRIVAIGCDPVSSRVCLQLAERFPNVWFTAGAHPTYVTEITDPDWLERLRELAAHPKCVAIGEAGLDYYHPAPDGWTEADYRARQKEFFAAQLELAAETGKNVVVHQRDRSATDTPCWEDLKTMIAPWKGRLRAVFHCFLHPWTEAAPVVADGHLISFTGIVTYKNAPEVAACAADAPDGAFMLETDSPYLAPVPRRGQRNEPAFTRHTAEKIAELRGCSLEHLARVTEAAADSFFGWNSAARYSK